MKIRKVPKAEMNAKISEVAGLLQIDHLLDRLPAQLSGGQRQRVAMGRALVRDPKLFLFDEPLSNLDAKLRVEMRAEIKRLHKTTNASIVYVTHDQIEAMTLASRIVILKDGHIQQIGTPAEIYDRPANTFVADFMGSPPMNIVPAEVTSDGLQLGETTLKIESWHPRTMRERIQLGIRPEHLRLANDDYDFAITPTMIENTGAESYVSFDIAGVSVTARIAGRIEEDLSTPLKLRIDPDALSFFTDDTGMRIAHELPAD